MTATAETKTGTAGRVVRITGPVVDIEFPRGSVPQLFNALHAEGWVEMTDKAWDGIHRSLTDAVSVFTSSFHCRAAGRWLASRASRPAEKPGIEQQEADIYISGLRARDGSSEGGHTFIHRAKRAEDVT